MIKLNKRGDTIVEVLIAIIVLSTVLVTAYALATRSLKENQQAQEHSQGLKIAEGQLEALKSWYDAGNSVNVGNGFCFNSSRNLVQDNIGGLGTFGSGEPSATVPDPHLVVGSTGYPAACTQTLAQAVPCTAGSSTCYYIGMRHYNDVAGSTLFTVTVRWASIIGGQDEVALNYRMYR